MASHRFQKEYSGHRTDWNTIHEWELWNGKTKQILKSLENKQVHIVLVPSYSVLLIACIHCQEWTHTKLFIETHELGFVFFF